MMLEDAITNGVDYWDVVLSKILSILLISSLCCRTEDVIKDRTDRHKLSYLAYQDVVIKWVKLTELNNLKATVVIRNEKDHK